MKEAITSGIVYPALVLTLSRDDRFRCIGGTSAGAIAAAVTAAAECGREAKGFEKLDQVREQLGRAAGKDRMGSRSQLSRCDPKRLSSVNAIAAFGLRRPWGRSGQVAALPA